jgi:hypothetical protein
MNHDLYVLSPGLFAGLLDGGPLGRLNRAGAAGSLLLRGPASPVRNNVDISLLGHGASFLDLLLSEAGPAKVKSATDRTQTFHP